MTCVGSVRQLTEVLLNVGVCSSACDGGNKSCLYLKEDKWPCCTKTSYWESCVKLANTWLKFMPFVCFMGPPTTGRLLSLLLTTSCETEELSGALRTFWLQAKCKCKNVDLFRVNCKEVHLCSLFFYSFVNAEVIVALQGVRLTAWVQFFRGPSKKKKNKGIQPSQTWHTRLLQDGPPHESI